jgi:glutamine amidotransferase
MIVVVDYGMGNLHSVLHKLNKLGVDALVSKKPEDIEVAEKLILPGVGSFAAGMKNLNERGLIDVLNREVVDNKKPLLGICLGMQLLTKHSQEGDVDGFGWIDAQTKKFSFKQGDNLRIPHVGWNTLEKTSDDPLLSGVEVGQRFYFTHSYHVSDIADDFVLAKTNYGYDFASVVRKENIYGVQFHPEKSHKKGMIVIKNFLEGSE